MVFISFDYWSVLIFDSPFSIKRSYRLSPYVIKKVNEIARYIDVLIITNNQSEADEINRLLVNEDYKRSNVPYFAIAVGSSQFHGRRYKHIVHAYDKTKLPEQLSAKIEHYLKHVNYGIQK